MTLEVATILDRMAITALQPGFVGFTLSPAFADAIRSSCDTRHGRVFGTARYHVVRRQKKPSLAWWSIDALSHFLERARRN